MQVKQLRLHVLQRLDFLKDVRRILIRQQSEVDAFETESLAPLRAVRFGKLAGENGLPRPLLLLLLLLLL